MMNSQVESFLGRPWMKARNKGCECEEPIGQESKECINQRSPRSPIMIHTNFAGYSIYKLMNKYINLSIYIYIYMYIIVY